jgi:hypothetical protein
MTTDDLFRAYLHHFPAGTYHQRDEAPGVLFRDGERVLAIDPPTKENGMILAAMVLALNHRQIKPCPP